MALVEVVASMRWGRVGGRVGCRAVAVTFSRVVLVDCLRTRERKAGRGADVCVAVPVLAVYPARTHSHLAPYCIARCCSIQRSSMEAEELHPRRKQVHTRYGQGACMSTTSRGTHVMRCRPGLASPGRHMG